MRVIDIAKILAPDLPKEITGIRPGEKLHEIMITSEDSRTTLDLGDRYVIEPSIALWDRKSFLFYGVNIVPEGFSYSSETNKMWLDKETFILMLNENYREKN